MKKAVFFAFLALIGLVPPLASAQDFVLKEDALAAIDSLRRVLIQNLTDEASSEARSQFLKIRDPIEDVQFRRLEAKGPTAIMTTYLVMGQKGVLTLNLSRNNANPNLPRSLNYVAWSDDDSVLEGHAQRRPGRPGTGIKKEDLLVALNSLVGASRAKVGKEVLERFGKASTHIAKVEVRERHGVGLVVEITGQKNLGQSRVKAGTLTIVLDQSGRVSKGGVTFDDTRPDCGLGN